MRQPEEIKKGLECCFSGRIGRCKDCPYRGLSFCNTIMGTNAVFLVRQLEAQVPRWISVKERLPEYVDNYLVHNGDYSNIATYWEGGRWMIGGLWTDDVTHWMPLPELPKEG